MATESVPPEVLVGAAVLAVEENNAAALTTDTLLAAARALLAKLTRRWVTVVGQVGERVEPGTARATATARVVAEFQAEVARLRPVFTDAAERIPAVAGPAFATGARQAAAEMGGDPADTPDAPGLTADVVHHVRAAVTTKLDMAAERARAGFGSHAGMVHATQPVFSAVSTVDAATRAAVHRAANEGAREVADAAGAQRLWVAERDACVHCLAYHGHLADPGRGFRVGLTFGDKPVVPWPDPTRLDGPPLHPNCRCRTTPWLGATGSAPGVPELPVVLRKEAQRSVVLGFALPSESTPARARAAERLLAKNPRLPKTVLARARRRLVRGVFVTTPAP